MLHRYAVETYDTGDVSRSAGGRIFTDSHANVRCVGNARNHALAAFGKRLGGRTAVGRSATYPDEVIRLSVGLELPS